MYLKLSTRNYTPGKEAIGLLPHRPHLITVPYLT